MMPVQEPDLATISCDEVRTVELLPDPTGHVDLVVMGASHIDLWRPLLKERRFRINRVSIEHTVDLEKEHHMVDPIEFVRHSNHQIVPGQDPEFLRWIRVNDIAEGDRDILCQAQEGQGAFEGGPRPACPHRRRIGASTQTVCLQGANHFEIQGQHISTNLVDRLMLGPDSIVRFGLEVIITTEVEVPPSSDQVPIGPCTMHDQRLIPTALQSGHHVCELVNHIPTRCAQGPLLRDETPAPLHQDPSHDAPSRPRLFGIAQG